MDFIDNIGRLQSALESAKSLRSEVELSGREILDTLRSGKKILTCGNGGSAADALHMAEEFVGRYSLERVSVPAICLCADTTVLTCILNDYGADKIFSRQVEGLGHIGDVLVGFSTSGNSANVQEAIVCAKRCGMKTILVSGKDGGRMRGIAGCDIIVPSFETARIQEVHTLILHSWLEMVDEEFAVGNK